MQLTSDDMARQTAAPLGAFWRPEATMFRVWAPQASAVFIRLYSGWQPEPDEFATEEYPMTKESDGCWETSVGGDQAGRYYTVATDYPGRGRVEGVDPYARAVGPGGRRGYLFDPRTTDPEGWSDDRPPPLEHVLDSVIYELHVRDASSLASSGIRHRGQFLGLAEEGTVSPEGLPTGLDHIASLGVTHVHLLPVFDYEGADDLEYRPDDYNWGYNPRNFNALKPAYSTDPLSPDTGIREFKQLVAAFHRRGLRVVLDMVYNHTFATLDSALNTAYPNFYYRMHGQTFSDGSGCGNELATERPMVRRYILDSLKYWKEEFHVDGFRFDLMGLYDIDTVNEIAHTSRKGDPAFLIYGEGWTGGLSALPDDRKALKANATRTPDVAYFSDENRDALKGHVFEADKQGFVNGGGQEWNVKFAVSGCTAHPALGRGTWAAGPAQVVNYIAAHDNHTLSDKLAHTNPHQTPAEREAMARLAHAAVFLSQGIPFLHAGEEFLRTKGGIENSYKSPDRVNGLDWTALSRHGDCVEWIKKLIALRRQRPEFRLRDSASVLALMSFPELLEPHMVAWRVGHLYAVLNAHPNEREVYLPAGNWTVLADGSASGTAPQRRPSNNMLVVAGRSAMVLADVAP